MPWWINAAMNAVVYGGGASLPPCRHTLISIIRLNTSGDVYHLLFSIYSIPTPVYTFSLSIDTIKKINSYKYNELQYMYAETSAYCLTRAVNTRLMMKGASDHLFLCGNAPNLCRALPPAH